MNRLLLVLALFFSNTLQIFIAKTHAAAPAIEYRRATEDDVDHMFTLIEQFDDDDDRQLAIPPTIGREAWLLDEIRKNHFFVACDPTEEENPIVGFCKIFIVEPNDILGIIGEELGAIKPHHFNLTMKIPHCNYLYKITEYQADDFKTRIKPIRSAPPCQLDLNDVYIYLGTNYTKSSHRGQGINTALEQVAFDLIRAEVIAELTPTSSIYYIFGVVEENWGKQTRLRSFTKFARSLLPRIRATVPVFISFTAFSTVKPILMVVDDDDDLHNSASSPKVVRTPQIPNSPTVGVPGFGCFLKFEIPSRYHADLGMINPE